MEGEAEVVVVFPVGAFLLWRVVLGGRRSISIGKGGKGGGVGMGMGEGAEEREEGERGKRAGEGRRGHQHANIENRTCCRIER